MIYAQNHDSASVFGLLTMPNVLQKTTGRTDAANVDPPLATHAYTERDMPLNFFTPGVCPAQPLEDPVISAARIINDAATLDRALAARKALRAKRSDAAKRGWEARRVSA